ncbi:MAG: hypothetical protein HOK58_14140 [Acidimicrobiaceae bacterium]|nr:hypothetical protein [Acidimicrobiaceae bacterium]
MSAPPVHHSAETQARNKALLGLQQPLRGKHRFGYEMQHRLNFLPLTPPKEPFSVPKSSTSSAFTTQVFVSLWSIHVDWTLATR